MSNSITKIRVDHGNKTDKNPLIFRDPGTFYFSTVCGA
jgi:hypothetical protein